MNDYLGDTVVKTFHPPRRTVVKLLIEELGIFPCDVEGRVLLSGGERIRLVRLLRFVQHILTEVGQQIRV